MTDPNQLVVLECDWMTQDDCWLRSDPVQDYYLQLNAWSQGWYHTLSGDWVCGPCWKAFKRVEKEWK